MAKNELTTQDRVSVLSTLGGKYSVEPAKLLTTLKNTAFKGATDDQMLALCVVANEYGLNPFTKEIYAFPDKGGGIVPVIGVDGWYSMVNSHPEYDGVQFSEERDDKGELIATTCTLHRKDRAHPTTVTEYVSENKRNTEPWKNQPTRMNRHRAFVQCARIAFSISLSDPEDAERAIDYGRLKSANPRKELAADANPFSKQSPPNGDPGEPDTVERTAHETKAGAASESPAETGDGPEGDIAWTADGKEEA